MAKVLRLLPLALLVASALGPGAGGAALEFGGATGQWARYARWDASSSGELSFSLKTNVSRALVLYLDDGGNCDFLELLILEGRFRLRFTISCAEPASLHLETPVNDDRWHMLLLTRNYRETMLVVDGEARVAEVKSKRRDMTVESDLFVGGIPPDVRLSALTLSTVKYEMPFRGMVANLKVGDTPPALLGSQGIRSDTEYLCTKQNPCVNGGICTVVNSEVQCDCSLTGFQGKFCSEAQGQGQQFQTLASQPDDGSLHNPSSRTRHQIVLAYVKNTLPLLFYMQTHNTTPTCRRHLGSAHPPTRLLSGSLLSGEGGWLADGGGGNRLGRLPWRWAWQGSLSCSRRRHQGRLTPAAAATAVVGPRKGGCRDGQAGRLLPRPVAVETLAQAG
ncbi:neurexin-2-beta isoform X28 [Podarcis lilfordi]|uniref:Neurexin-2-beta isoform X28 n=1 Tax=Podarcis lilfordi TaxID=74358 RepID=A0AA35LKH8_9SAUR|nr:neurexin-2-beta isoform X28 [Podarcis lilfordi]